MLGVADVRAAEPGSSSSTLEASRRDAVDERIEAGRSKFDAGDYVGAVAEFEAAYEIDPDPNFLYNIGRTYEEGGQLAAAADYYRRYARQPGISLEMRRKTSERIKVLDEVLAQTEPEQAPEPEPVVESAPPSVAEPEYEPRPRPVRSLGTDDGLERAGRGLRIAGYSMLAVGASTLAAGGVLGGLASRDASQLETTEEPQTRIDLIERGRARSLAADVSFIAGGIIATTGLVVALVGVGRRNQGRRRASLAPALGRHGASASLRVRF
ncbi:MAG: tetratricopeptide repeat protein [Myxococcota bacterium]